MVVLPVSYKLRCMRILKVVFIVMLSSSACNICPEQASVRINLLVEANTQTGIVSYQINWYFTNVCAACFDLACLTFKPLPPAHYKKFK